MRTRSLPTDTRQSLSLIHILQYLRIIDKKSEVIERKLHQSQKNEELIELLELEKSLVYFTTSLRSNEVVLEKLLRTEKIKKYPEDTDLLEDVIVENKQAIEMAGIYSGILSLSLIHIEMCIRDRSTCTLTRSNSSSISGRCVSKGSVWRSSSAAFLCS